MNPQNPKFCMLNNLRRATRILAQHMDQGLAQVGLKSTQFSLLVTLKQAGAVPLTQLADLLTLERTTLTRNLKPMLEKGWVKKVSGEDQRVKLISITDTGRSLLEQAEPIWRKSQMNVVDKLGEVSWLEHYRAVDDIADSVS